MPSLPSKAPGLPITLLKFDQFRCIFLSISLIRRMEEIHKYVAMAAAVPSTTADQLDDMSSIYYTRHVEKHPDTS